ncbi:MAG: hypothetical protein LBV39_04115, partial [Bacteroidales bacterium]|nr:hypothetical protein [Bacteroidales bacterium]
MILCIFSIAHINVSAKPPKKGKEEAVPVQAKPVLANDADSANYYLGYLYAKQIVQAFPADFNLNAFTEGAKKAIEPAVAISEAEANEFLQNFFTNAQQKINQANLEEGRKFLDENAKKPGIIVTPSGLQYRVITEGTGVQPKASDEVDVVYHGTLIDGTVFDSAKERGDTVSFGV